MSTINKYFEIWKSSSDINGIRLHIEDGTNVEDRIFLSNGLLSGMYFDSEKYSENSHVPNLPWRLPNKKEKDYLYNNSDNIFTMSSNIGIIKFPPILFNDLLNNYHAAIKNIKYLSEFNKVAQLITETDIFSSKLSFQGKVELSGIASKPPGLLTVTENKRTNKFIGMHLDSWDGLPLSKRENATNRVCINLSKEKRYLLFINLTLLEMKNILHLQDDEVPDNLCMQFMNKFPSYPVVRLSIDPFEAYVAPTENMIHDGSTLGMETNSICFTFRGNFNLKHEYIS